MNTADQIARDWLGWDEKGYRRILSDLEGATILFFGYVYEDYGNTAKVIYEKNGKLYEVNGAHCSCHGLEGQWLPKEISWEALHMRLWDHYRRGNAVEELIGSHT